MYTVSPLQLPRFLELYLVSVSNNCNPSLNPCNPMPSWYALITSGALSLNGIRNFVSNVFLSRFNIQTTSKFFLTFRPLDIKTCTTEHLGMILFTKLVRKRFGHLATSDGLRPNLLTKKSINAVIFFSEHHRTLAV